MAMNCWCGGGVERVDGVLWCLESRFHDPLATGEPERVDRLYVSGPMTGHKENNYPAFYVAAHQLREVGYSVVNPAEYGAPTHARVSYTEILREDLRQLLSCHGVAVLDGWENSNGAATEVQVARTLRMPVFPVATWVQMSGSLEELEQVANTELGA